MERRIARVNISLAGGTAGSGSKTCKVTLPTTWVEMLGITKENRDLELTFDGTRITMSRRSSGSEFAEQQLAQGHEVRILRFYDGNVLCSTIYADFTVQTVVVENQAVPVVKTAFGNNPFPNWEDFQRFLEERCIPRQRAGLLQPKLFTARSGADYCQSPVVQSLGEASAGEAGPPFQRQKTDRLSGGNDS